MNSKELTVWAVGHRVRVFLQAGFFDPTYVTPILHRHIYTEIHLQLSGSTVYDCDGVPLTLHAGEALVLSEHMLHRSREAGEGSARVAFQVDAPLSHGIYSMPEGLASLVHQGMLRFRDEGKSEGLSAALSAVCAEFLDATAEARPHALRERRFLISEFFTRHYQEDVTLSDLASLLCLGEKQTARLLREETGHTFREELTAYRREAARMLMKEGKYSLSEIAERVGYRSYSGFWKALRCFRILA